jgi:hypothetical protein
MKANSESTTQRQTIIFVISDYIRLISKLAAEIVNSQQYCDSRENAMLLLLWMNIQCISGC